MIIRKGNHLDRPRVISNFKHEHVLLVNINWGLTE